MNPTRLLIVDDEPLIRSGIRQIVSALPGFEVIGEAENGEDAFRAIVKGDAQIVLLDIRMPDCSGLDVVRRVGVERMPPVVFITAYDQFAIQAFEVNAVDYLLKPFDEDRLIAGLRRAQRRLASEGPAQMLAELRSLLRHNTQSYAHRIAARDRNGYAIVAVDTIDWIEAADNYVELHCGPKTYLVRESMNNIEQQLDPSVFIRLHRSRIANASRIVAIAPLANGVFEVKLSNGTRITTGRQYRNGVLKLIGKAG